MDQSLETWFAEYSRLSSALDSYVDRISSKVYDPGTPRELTEAESTFFDLYYYWSAALVNSGDVFGYVPFILEHRAKFERIGARGTLMALGKLMAFYRQQQELQDDIAKDYYWLRTKEERSPAEELAEDVHEFARLLLAYARANLPAPDEA